MLVSAVWLTLIVVVLFTLMITATWSVLMVQGTVGVGVTAGVAWGVGVDCGVGVGVAVGVDAGVGVADGKPSPTSRVGVGVGVESLTSTGSGVGVADELEPDDGVEPLVPADRSPTLRLTFGTESSNT